MTEEPGNNGSNAAPDDGMGEVPPDDSMVDDGPDMLEFDDPWLDPPSQGGTLTFESIGSPGWYPSRRDPASGQCDAIQTDTCCMTRHEVSTDNLSPWDEELIMTLRGPMRLKQISTRRAGQ